MLFIFVYTHKKDPVETGSLKNRNQNYELHIKSIQLILYIFILFIFGDIVF